MQTLQKPHAFAVLVDRMLSLRTIRESMAPNAVIAMERRAGVSPDAVRKRSLRYTGCFLPQNTRARRLAWLGDARSVRLRNARRVRFARRFAGRSHRIVTA